MIKINEWFLQPPLIKGEEPGTYKKRQLTSMWGVAFIVTLK
jgi:hypothetical protein